MLARKYVTNKIAALINEYGTAIHQTCFCTVLLHTCNLLLKLLGIKKVIRIQGSNIFPPGPPYRSIPGGTHSCVALSHELNSGILFLRIPLQWHLWNQ